MSIGFGGHANLVAYDDHMIIYAYACYDINNKEYRKYMEFFDGEIIILREALVEPEIHRKLKRMKSGRKRIVEKRVRQDVPYESLYASGKITVKNASGTWHTYESGFDFIAHRLIFKIFDEYQNTGEIPESVGGFW